MNKSASGKGKIEGVVLNESRQPLAGATIVITATTATEPFPEIAPVSNQEGKFSFPQLPTGRYTLKASIEGYPPGSAVATVASDRTSQVEFIMKK